MSWQTSIVEEKTSFYADILLRLSEEAALSMNRGSDISSEDECQPKKKKLKKSGDRSKRNQNACVEHKYCLFLLRLGVNFFKGESISSVLWNVRREDR